MIPYLHKKYFFLFQRGGGRNIFSYNLVIQVEVQNFIIN